MTVVSGNTGVSGVDKMAIRRWASAGAAGLLALGLGVHPAPALAAVGDSDLAVGEKIVRGGSVADCPAAISGAGPSTRSIPADGAWRTQNLDRSGVLGTSKVRGIAVSRGKVTTDSRGASRVDVSISNAVSLTPSGTSPCSISYATNGSTAAFDVAVTKRSWLVLGGTVRGRGEVIGSLEAQRMDGSGRVAIAPGRSATVLVPSGWYAMGAQAGSRTNVPPGSTTATQSTSIFEGFAAIIPVGTRRSLSGNGLGYVSVDHRDCTLNRVRLPFTSRARASAAKITLYVNGVRRAVLTGSGLQRTSYTLGRIDPSSLGAVKVVIRTKSGSTLTSSSTSWACR